MPSLELGGSGNKRCRREACVVASLPNPYNIVSTGTGWYSLSMTGLRGCTKPKLDIPSDIDL